MSAQILARELLFHHVVSILISRRAIPVFRVTLVISLALQGLAAQQAEDSLENEEFDPQTQILYHVLKESNRLIDVISQSQSDTIGSSLSRMAVKDAKKTLEQLLISAIPESGGPPFAEAVMSEFQATPEFHVVKDMAFVFYDDHDLNLFLKATELTSAQNLTSSRSKIEPPREINEAAESTAHLESLAKAMLALPLDRPNLSTEKEADWILRNSSKECAAPQSFQQLEQLKLQVNSPDSFRTFVCATRALLKQMPSRAAWSAAMTLRELIGQDTDDFLADEIPGFSANHIETLAKILSGYAERRLMLLTDGSTVKPNELKTAHASRLFQGTETDFARRADNLFSMAKLEYQALLLLESRQQNQPPLNCWR